LNLKPLRELAIQRNRPAAEGNSSEVSPSRVQAAELIADDGFSDDVEASPPGLALSCRHRFLNGTRP
jgi:hypothetical protein